VHRVVEQTLPGKLGQRTRSRKPKCGEGYPGAAVRRGLPDSRVSLAKSESGYPRADVVEGCIAVLAGSL